MILVDYLPILMLVSLAMLLFSGFPVGGVLAGVESVSQSWDWQSMNFRSNRSF